MRLVIDVVNTIEACRGINGNKSSVRSPVERKLVCVADSKPSSVILTPPGIVPALLNRAATAIPRNVHDSAKRRTEANDSKSRRINSRASRRSPIDSIILRHLSSLRHASITRLTPRSKSPSVIALPIPPVAPVTIQVPSIIRFYGQMPLVSLLFSPTQAMTQPRLSTAG